MLVNGYGTFVPRVKLDLIALNQTKRLHDILTNTILFCKLHHKSRTVKLQFI